MLLPRRKKYLMLVYLLPVMFCICLHHLRTRKIMNAINILPQSKPSYAAMEQPKFDENKLINKFKLIHMCSAAHS